MSRHRTGVSQQAGPEDSPRRSPQGVLPPSPLPSLAAPAQSHYHCVHRGPGVSVAPCGSSGPGDSGGLLVEAWVPSSLLDLRRYKERDPHALPPSPPPPSRSRPHPRQPPSQVTSPGLHLGCCWPRLPSSLRCVNSRTTRQRVARQRHTAWNLEPYTLANVLPRSR